MPWETWLKSEKEINKNSKLPKIEADDNDQIDID